MANLYIFPPNRATLNSGGLATAANQVSSLANEAIIIDELQRDIVDFMDAPLLDASSTNVPASASLPLEVVASLAANVQAIRMSDTMGYFTGVYVGPASSEVLKAIIQPGDDGIIPCRIASGSRISLRNLENFAITSGNLALEFLG